jgi:crotonobetainyl-CoA:carnitine CoA-transferase CaiB-like acyl-CoA transferase
LMAYYHRMNTGEGQFVDVSMQESALSPNMNVLQMWDLNKYDFKRVGSVSFVAGTGVKQPIYFRCKDGYVMILAIGGNEPYVSSSKAMVKWMEEEKMAPEWLLKLDWWKDYNASKLKQDLADKVGAAIEAFTLTKTKEELYQVGAYQRAMLIAPVANTKDISEDVQLKARHFWVDLPHPELKRDVPYCGPFILLSETPIEYKRRAPLTGEHNREIYSEIGVKDADLAALKNKGVI